MNAHRRPESYLRLIQARCPFAHSRWHHAACLPSPMPPPLPEIQIQPDACLSFMPPDAARPPSARARHATPPFSIRHTTTPVIEATVAHSRRSWRHHHLRHICRHCTLLPTILPYFTRLPSRTAKPRSSRPFTQRLPVITTHATTPATSFEDGSAVTANSERHDLRANAHHVRRYLLCGAKNAAHQRVRR